MPLDFPASPSVNDTYTFSGRTWKWNGSGWQLTSEGVVGTTNIDNDAVTYAKIQNISATDKLLGRSTAGAGDIEEIACTAAGRALLDDADAAAQRDTLGLGTMATQAASSYAELASPALTGTPTAPTAALGTNTTQLATTAFVNSEIANDAPTKTGTGASGTWGINITGRGFPKRSDGGDLNFFWSGQGGQPTWLWGGNDGANMYVYNPSNFSVNYAGTAGTCNAQVAIGGGGASPVSNNVEGTYIGSGNFNICRNNEAAVRIGRTNDGALVAWWSGGAQEGVVSVNGTSVTYGGFLGTHWGRLADEDKPEILVGTILETVDKLIYWKLALFTVDDEEKRMAYNGDAAIGDTVQVEYEGSAYAASIINEVEDPMDINKHTCVKINDTPASAAVFGVFVGWDDEQVSDDIIGGWNDLTCGSLGNYFIRIAPDQDPQIGDLIEADGNGCGVVQADDIIRTRTVGKITSTIRQRVYDDGSFLVTAVLYCG